MKPESKGHFEALIKSVGNVDGSVKIEGYASTPHLDRGCDIVLPEAFRKTLKTYMSNPVLLWDHGRDPVKGYKPIGKVISADVVDGGLKIVAIVSDLEIAESIKRGELKTMSFGYEIVADKIDVEEDPKTGENIRTIKELQLYEISVVAIPMNPNAMFSMSKSFKNYLDDLDSKYKQKLLSNDDGYKYAKELIANNNIDFDTPFSFTVEDANGLLGDPPDWDNYAKWFLAKDDTVNSKTKGAYKYPYGKEGSIYMKALKSIKQRAAQQGFSAIGGLANDLMMMIDNMAEGMDADHAVDENAKNDKTIEDKKSDDNNNEIPMTKNKEDKKEVEKEEVKSTEEVLQEELETKDDAETAEELEIDVELEDVKEDESELEDEAEAREKDAEIVELDTEGESTEKSAVQENTAVEPAAETKAIEPETKQDTPAETVELKKETIATDVKTVETTSLDLSGELKSLQSKVSEQDSLLKAFASKIERHVKFEEDADKAIGLMADRLIELEKNVSKVSINRPFAMVGGFQGGSADETNGKKDQQSGNGIKNFLDTIRIVPE